ncbi:Acetyl-CoA carboxylase biotin carboxyl carrier protein subunit [uncultured Gammaproteobacteria bacterium]
MKLQIGIDGKNYELEVEIVEEDYAPRPRGYLPPHAPPSTLRSLHVPPSAPAPAAGPATPPVDEAHVCRSPVAGVVIRIKAQPGQQLQPDDLIMVLEAMKMETNVTAPVAGKVKAIKVVEGDGVKVNQVLVEFE